LTGSAEHANLELAHDVFSLGTDQNKTLANRTLAAAHRAIEHREAFLQQHAPRNYSEPLHWGTAVTDNSLTILPEVIPTSFTDRIAWASSALGAQADLLNISMSRLPAAANHSVPSDAVLDLLARHAVTPTLEQRLAILGLDSLQQNLRQALTNTINRFMDLESAAWEAYEEADYRRIISAVENKSLIRDGRNVTLLGEAGVDVPLILKARAGLNEAAAALTAAYMESGPALRTPVQVPPVVAIDLSSTSATYTEDYALIIEGGGNDRFENNAGGSNYLGRTCDLLSVSFIGTGTLIDLAGDDAYVSEADCGVNGGGAFGVGFLFDAGGNDTYGGTGIGKRESTLASANAVARNISQGGAERFIVAFNGTPPVERGDSLHGASVHFSNHVLNFSSVTPTNVTDFLARSANDSRIRFMEADALVFPTSFQPNDPGWGQQYGPAHVRAPEAWTNTLGQSRKNVCILDEGVRYTHEDLHDRWVGGYDFIDHHTDPWVSTSYHGTHVTGIAAGGINNGRGIAGMGNVGITAGRVIQPGVGGFWSDIASAIQWCADNDGHVISMSFAGRIGSALAEEAVNYAWARGSLLVAGAGNGGCSDCIEYPAKYERVMAVTCTNAQTQLCSFSSTGPQAALAAPGEDIWSLASSSDHAYGVASGTSMSTPHVSGIAALVWSRVPSLTNVQLRSLLESNARDLGAPGRDAQFGFGLVDAKATLDAALAIANPPPATSSIHTETFEDGVASWWSLSGLWHVTTRCGGPSQGWHHLAYTQERDCTYNAGVQTTGQATFAIDLSSARVATLRFEHRWETESSLRAVDKRAVEINVGGSAWHTLKQWDSTTPNQPTWVEEALSLDSFTGAARRIRFTFDSVDGLSNSHAGWFIDAVEVIADARTPGLPGSMATNGGGYFGLGLLLDLDGNDTYQGGWHGVNGGGWLGVGMLLDAAGTDVYVAGWEGTNGGGHFGGIGFLADLVGDDRYEAGSYGVNGGGSGVVTPIPLLPFAETYGVAGAGILADRSGNDLFRAGSSGVNGGGSHGSGALVDIEGNDEYTAASLGANGGAFAWITQTVDTDPPAVGNGLLIDVQGDDVFEGAAQGVNGGAGGGILMFHTIPLVTVTGYATGYLVDGAGNDLFEATSRGVNGGTDSFGMGLLLDIQGSDRYAAASVGVNGGARRGPNPVCVEILDRDSLACVQVTVISIGTLLDRHGADNYLAGALGVNGAMQQTCCPGTSPTLAALLLDGGGTDVFQDAEPADINGSGTDKTVVPKGTLGAQIDHQIV
jgi:subtilisin family serine protease